MNKITIYNYDEIYLYSCARKEILQYWHDQGWLINSVKYLYEIKDKVLFIYRDIPYNKLAFFLAIPPMTLDNDYEKEYSLMVDVLNSGVSIRFSSEHLRLYKDFGIDNLHKEKVQTEYVYYTGDYSNENLVGKKGNYYRNAVNYLEKNGYEWIWESDNLFVGSLLSSITRVTKEWSKTKIDGSKFYHIKIFGYLKDAKILALSSPDKRIFGYNITQCIGNTVMYSCEKFLPVYHRQMKAVHYKLSEYWRNYLGKDIYMNKGASVGKIGMKQSKESLRPNEKLEIYKVKNGEK